MACLFIHNIFFLSRFVVSNALFAVKCILYKFHTNDLYVFQEKMSYLNLEAYLESSIRRLNSPATRQPVIHSRIHCRDWWYMKFVTSRISKIFLCLIPIRIFTTAVLAINLSFSRTKNVLERNCIKDVVLFTRNCMERPILLTFKNLDEYRFK